MKPNVNYLLVMPSFYGSVMWLMGLLFYYSRYIKWNETKGITHIVFWGTEFFLIIATIYFDKHYKRLYNNIVEKLQDETSSGLTFKPLILLHLIGFYGSYLFIRDYSAAVGGYTNFFLALVTSGAGFKIREANSETISLGTQLSYIGWMAIAATLFEVRRKNFNKRLGYFLCFLQFLPNLFYFDRTRPTWIFFTVFVSIFPIFHKMSRFQLVRNFLLSFILGLSLFVFIAVWSGKGWDFAEEGKMYENIYIYLCSGYAYFNEMVGVNAYHFFPERILYPLLKLLNAFSLAPPPPNQILDYLNVPVQTNVGTFLEPFYNDGGLLYVAVGVFIYSFGLNLLGYFLLKSRTPFNLYSLGNICFINFIGFFTPKIGTFPIWFIVFLACILSLWQKKYVQ